MNQTTERVLTLCADDFGQSAAINEGILTLLEMNRLGAVSVMSQGPAWAECASALIQYRQTADLGLHLNLTHRFGAEPATRPLGAWLLAAPLGWIDRAAVRDTFRRQIDLFVQQVGHLPDYLDGHQHVHAFASIRLVLTEVVAEYWQGPQQPWVRAPDQLLDDGGVPLKAWVLRTAARGFASSLAGAGLRYNAGFAGLYGLTTDVDFAALMQGWLRQLPSHTLIMVHPGVRSEDISDPIRAVRVAELEYLRSDAFAAQLRSSSVRLARLGFGN